MVQDFRYPLNSKSLSLRSRRALGDPQQFAGSVHRAGGKKKTGIFVEPKKNPFHRAKRAQDINI